MVECYKTGTPNERRTFWACFSGWALDTFDLQVFNFVMPSLMLAMSLTKSDAGSIATVALHFYRIAKYGRMEITAHSRRTTLLKEQRQVDGAVANISSSWLL